VIPGLGLILVSAILIRERSGEQRQAHVLPAQRLPSQAQPHKVDKGGLATAGGAQQHQARVPVQLLQRRGAAHLPARLLTAHQALVGFRGEREQGGVHRAQVQAGLRLAGGLGVNTGEGEVTGGL